MKTQSIADKLKDLSLGLSTRRYGQVKVVEKLDSIAEELRRAGAEYARKNPLGGPAKRFDAVADRLRAGEDYHAVLHDMGLADVSASSETTATGSDKANVPAGWKLLPEEPTQEMLDAWHETGLGVFTHHPSTRPGVHWSDSEARYVACYRAMLNAAPQELPAVGSASRQALASDRPAAETPSEMTPRGECRLSPDLVRDSAQQPAGAAPVCVDKQNEVTVGELEKLPHASYGTLGGWTAHYAPVREVLDFLASRTSSSTSLAPGWIGDLELWHKFLCWNREGTMLVNMGSEYAVAQVLCRMISERFALYCTANPIPKGVLEKAIQFKGRADDAGFLARAIINIADSFSASSNVEDPGTLKILTALVERAYGIFTASGVLRVAEQDPDSNDPIVAWASDVRSILYRNKPAAIDTVLAAVNRAPDRSKPTEKS